MTSDKSLTFKEFHSAFPDLLAIFANKLVLHFTDEPYCTNIQSTELKSWIENPNRISWACYYHGEFVGITSALLVAKHQTASISIIVAESFQGKGFSKQMLQHEIQQLKSMNFARIEAQICTENSKSISLLESLNFECEGTLRKNFMIDGELKDSFMYALIFEP